MILNLPNRATWRMSVHRVFGIATGLSLSLALLCGAEAATLTARGNEPGWRIDLSDKDILFQGQDGVTFAIQPVPEAVTANGVDTYSASVDGKPFKLTVADRICADTMTGMPYPKTATLVLGDRTLSGCAGEPAFLLHGEWRIEEIGGSAIIAKSEPSILFDTDGSISGNASCNRLMGHFTLTGEGLSISETGASRMMCDQPLTVQERTLLASLQSVRRFEVVSVGQIRLLGDDNRTLVTIQR